MSPSNKLRWKNTDPYLENGNVHYVKVLQQWWYEPNTLLDNGELKGEWRDVEVSE